MEFLEHIPRHVRQAIFSYENCRRIANFYQESRSSLSLSPPGDFGGSFHDFHHLLLWAHLWEGELIQIQKPFIKTIIVVVRWWSGMAWVFSGSWRVFWCVFSPASPSTPKATSCAWTRRSRRLRRWVRRWVKLLPLLLTLMELETICNLTIVFKL